MTVDVKALIDQIAFSDERFWGRQAITRKQLRGVLAFMRPLAPDDADRHRVLQEMFSVSSTNDLSFAQAHAILSVSRGDYGYLLAEYIERIVNDTANTADTGANCAGPEYDYADYLFTGSSPPDADVS